MIYYFHNFDTPLFPMAIFAKNVQADLTPTRRRALVKQLAALKAVCKEYRTR